MSVIGRYPTAYLIGAPRCGTTSVFRALESCENVGLPRGKEPHYWCFRRMGEFRGPGDYQGIRSEREYLDLYRDVRDRPVWIDGSTSYLSCAAAAEVLTKEGNGWRMVAVLRHPVWRCFSHYWQHRRQGREDARSVVEAIEREEERRRRKWSPFWQYSYLGQYDQHLEHYKGALRDGRLLVVFYEDLLRDPEKVLGQIARHLGGRWAGELVLPHENVSGEVRFKWLMWAAQQGSPVYQLGRILMPRKVRHQLLLVVSRWNRRRVELAGRERRFLERLYMGLPDRLAGLGLDVPREWDDLRSGEGAGSPREARGETG